MHGFASADLRLNHFLRLHITAEPLPKSVDERNEPETHAHPAQYEPDDVAEQIVCDLETHKGDKRQK